MILFFIFPYWAKISLLCDHALNEVFNNNILRMSCTNLHINYLRPILHHNWIAFILFVCHKRFLCLNNMHWVEFLFPHFSNSQHTFVSVCECVLRWYVSMPACGDRLQTESIVLTREPHQSNKWGTIAHIQSTLKNEIQWFKKI